MNIINQTNIRMECIESLPGFTDGMIYEVCKLEIQNGKYIQCRYISYNDNNMVIDLNIILLKYNFKLA